MSEFGLIDSFHIDKNELESLTKQECFVLGVEWQRILEITESGNQYKGLVHIENVVRLAKMLTKRGKKFEFSPVYMKLDDNTIDDSWVQLEIK